MLEQLKDLYEIASSIMSNEAFSNLSEESQDAIEDLLFNLCFDIGLFEKSETGCKGVN